MKFFRKVKRFGTNVKSFFLVKSQGFTLIELMIVIAIIGILAAIAIPQIGRYYNW